MTSSLSTRSAALAVKEDDRGADDASLVEADRGDPEGTSAVPSVKDGSYYCMDMRTLQSGTFKTLVDGLKDILNDTVIEFDKTGMKIMSFNTSLNVFVHLHIYAESLEYYHCDRVHRVGINMLHLNRLIKSITNEDTLTLFIESNNMNYLGIKIENNDRTRKTTNKLKTMDLNQPYRVSHMEFHKTITMHSPMLQKICRDMSSIAEFVEIKDVRDQLIFSCEGDFCSQETVLYDNRRMTACTHPSAGVDDTSKPSSEDKEGEEGEEGGDGGDDKTEGDDGLRVEGTSVTNEADRERLDDQGVDGSKKASSRGTSRRGVGGKADGADPRRMSSSSPPPPVATCGNSYIMTSTSAESVDAPEIVQGVFSLKYLTLFTKFTNLSSTVDLLMNNDFPLLVRYPVSSLGELKLLLSEKENDDDDAGY